MALRIPEGIPQVKEQDIVPVRKKDDQKDQFLKLLLAQLQNQDPLNPLSDVEMTQQLSQFSQLEQLFNLNSNFSELGKVFVSLNTLQAATLLGKNVKATGETVDIKSGLPETIRFNLPEQVQSIDITIESETGETVKKISVKDPGRLTEGEHELIWDGITETGKPAVDGTYTVRYEAKRVDGSLVPVHQYLDGKVTSVSVENGTVVLSVGDKKLNLEDIVEIRESI